jgi:hypothetical protein
MFSSVRPIWLAAALAVIASDAGAQTVFLQAAYGPDIRRFSADDTERVFDGTAGNVALAFGGFLTDHVAALIDMELGGSTTEARTVSLPIAGRPTTITTQYRLERRTWSALAGVHTARTRRVQLGVYAGLAFSSVRREVSSDAPPIVLSEPAEASVFTDRTADPVVAMDVAIRLGGPFSLLGGIRAQGLALSGDLRGITIRPRVGVRIDFQP